MADINSGPELCSWTVYAGDRNIQTFAFFASEGIPWDITGATIRAQSRLTANDPVIAVEAVCEITDAADGIATVEWDGEAVRAILGVEETWEGVWDLQVIEAGQTLPVTLLYGSWTALMDVTRD